MAERVRGVALCFNHEPGVSDAAARLAGLFLNAGVTVGVDGEYIGDPRFDGCAAGYDGCDALITLGGDGTLLRGCRDAVSRGIPVCGINLGHMGFLTSLEAGEAAECVRRLCDGDYTIERRMTVQADAPGAPLALNDCTITRADTSKRILSLEISVDGDQASAFSGDGLVIDGGGPLHGGVIDGMNDHRIVMAGAVLATRAEGPVTILGAEAVNKSYPEFFEHFQALGGKVDVEPAGR